MGTPHYVDPLALATPALLLLWLAVLLALLLWRRHIRNAPIAAYGTSCAAPLEPADTRPR